MRGKKSYSLLFICPLLVVFLSLGLVNSTVGNSICQFVFPIALLVSAFTVAGGAFTFPSRTFVSILLLVSSFVLFCYARVLAMTRLNLCFDPYQIVCIEGRTAYDSSLTSNGNHLMKIMLSGCSTVRGDSGSASGLVSVIGDRKEIVSFGTFVRLEGHFSDSLFIYDRIQVLGRGGVNAVRERLIEALEYRLAVSENQSSYLSALLLLGRSDYARTTMRELAQSCGCAHVLALSGMHLGIIAGICRRLFGRKHLGRVVSSLMVALFVFVAGPRPSLVRAAIAFYLGFLDIRLRTLLVFLLQMVMFPVSMTEVGCCYGYAAVFAIVFLSPYVEALLFQWMGRLAKLFSATVSVMLLSAPIQMLLSDRWYPAAIVASPVAGLLVAISMVLGLLLLLFGNLQPLLWLNDKAYLALENVFTYFGSWQPSKWKGYVVLICVLCSVVIVFASVRLLVRRRVEADLTERNKLRIMRGVE